MFMVIAIKWCRISKIQRAINFVKANGNIQLIRKKGIGHHPHSLEDPTPIVEFILKHTLTKNTSTEPVIRNTVLKNP